MTSFLLHEAVGHLLSGGTVPPSRFQLWKSATVAFDAFVGVLVIRGRSARWMWRCLYKTQPPRSFTWMQLTSGWLLATSDALRTALRAADAAAALTIFFHGMYVG